MQNKQTISVVIYSPTQQNICRKFQTMKLYNVKENPTYSKPFTAPRVKRDGDPYRACDPCNHPYCRPPVLINDSLTIHCRNIAPKLQ